MTHLPSFSELAQNLRNLNSSGSASWTDRKFLNQFLTSKPNREDVMSFVADIEVQRPLIEDIRDNAIDPEIGVTPFTWSMLWLMPIEQLKQI
jgi:hypothetical protein